LKRHHSVHDGARDVHCALSKVDVSPLQSEQLALSQPGGGRKEHERSLTLTQARYERLYFSGCQHTWRSAPLRTLSNYADRVAVKEFMTASMIEKNRENTSDFRTTVLPQGQTAKP
jgi:hypothetical protein